MRDHFRRTSKNEYDNGMQINPVSPIRIVEVSPRDGLQNLNIQVPTETKIQLIRDLAACGVRHIEVTSLVHPKRVPQMADAEAVFSAVRDLPEVHLSVLVPNLTGLERAISLGVHEVAFFLAASEIFSQKNTGCSIAESVERAKAVISRATTQGLRVRGYVSCVLGCPYEGKVSVNRVAELTQMLLDLGCYEVSLGDTIGVGTPATMTRLLDVMLTKTPADQLAVHCHDTRGQALANILISLNMGISVIDASVAGMGGCPYAPGASGNVATEDVLYLLQGFGQHTGIDLNALAKLGQTFVTSLGIPNQSRAGQVLAAMD